MKKKILLFEPDSFFRNTLLEHISLNRDFDVTEVGSVESVEYQSKKLPFDLIIMGTDQGENCLISVEKFIKKAKITNKMLFMIGMEPDGISSFEQRPEKHYFIDYTQIVYSRIIAKIGWHKLLISYIPHTDKLKLFYIWLENYYSSFSH